MSTYPSGNKWRTVETARYCKLFFPRFNALHISAGTAQTSHQDLGTVKCWTEWVALCHRITDFQDIYAAFSPALSPRIALAAFIQNVMLHSFAFYWQLIAWINAPCVSWLSGTCCSLCCRDYLCSVMGLSRACFAFLAILLLSIACSTFLVLKRMCCSLVSLLRRSPACCLDHAACRSLLWAVSIRRWTVLLLLGASLFDYSTFDNAGIRDLAFGYTI